MSGVFNKYDVITIPIIEKSNSNLVIKAKDKLKKGDNTNVIYKPFKDCKSSGLNQVENWLLFLGKKKQKKWLAKNVHDPGLLTTILV